jgi:hypothetical protein
MVVEADGDFSTAGVAAVRARRRRLKPCSSMRYEAIDDFPAQIPRRRQTLLGVINQVLASTQSNKHVDKNIQKWETRCGPL